MLKLVVGKKSDKMDYLKINFKEIDWQSPAKGVRQKVLAKGKQQLRLLEFSDGFIELHWCTKGHLGYVLEGSMQIDFEGTLLKYEKGDAFWIEEGKVEQHKVILGKEQMVLLILLEERNG